MNVRRVLPRLLIALAAVGLGLLAVELGLRRWPPPSLLDFASERALPGEAGRQGRDAFTVDEELGYRPVLDGEEFGPTGTVRNEYALEKPAGVKRILFLGDSVTRRGAIQDGLRACLGDRGFEYWNAGVTGYTTVQEVAYYRRFCAPLKADRVLLTFHLNDFETTPITFPDGDKLVRLYTKGSTRTLNPWLLRHSYLYRWYLGRSAAQAEPPPGAPPTEADTIERSLATLRDEVARDGGTLTVLVLPWLRPFEEWRGQRHKHDWILKALERLGIEHYAFVPTLERALADGVQVTEVPRDPQHPSPEFGLRMARDLLAAGFVP